MTRVLFVSPPRWNETLYPAMGAMGGMVKLPPIGMLFIAAQLRKQLGSDCRLFDYNIYDQQDYSLIDSVLRAFQPDVVGITTYSFIVYDVYRVAQRIREVLPSAKIVMGGKHVQLYPRETLRQPFVDYLVQGDGEVAMTELVRSIEGGELHPTDIQGVWFRHTSGEIHEGGVADTVTELDQLPPPDISLIDQGRRKRYGYKFGAGGLEATMYTSRGCPWKCSYCMSAYSDHRYYYHSPGYVLDEIERYVNDGYQVIHFMDDHFNLNINRAKEICQGIIDRKLPITWTMRGSAKFVDRELANLLAESHCERLNLGVESANEGVLNTFDRFTKTEQVRQAFEQLDGRGIALAGYFILGFPQESREMAWNSVELAVSLPIDYAQFSVLFPAPGTPYLHKLLDAGVLAQDPYADYSESPQKVFKLPYYGETLTETEVAALIEDAYRRFYLRPSLVARHLRKLRSPRELWTKSKLGVQLAYFSGRKLLTGAQTNWEATPRHRNDLVGDGLSVVKLYH